MHTRETQIGIIASVAFHALLAALLIKVVVEVYVEPPSFTTVSLGQVPADRILDMLGGWPEQGGSEGRSSPAERAQVPERRMTEIEEPTISVSREEKLAAEAARTVQGEKRAQIVARAPMDRQGVPISSTERKATFEGRRIHVESVPGQGTDAEGIGAEVQTAFKIEGEVKGRKILYKALPKYPEDLQKEVDITISFSVLPSGRVSIMRPVKKGDTRLENLSMEALKIWKFNILPEDVVQTGKITFMYRLK